MAIDHSLLSWITFLPLATGVALLVLSSAAGALGGGSGLPVFVWRAVALASTLLTFLLSRAALHRLRSHARPAIQFVEHAAWIPDYGINYFVGIDGISLVLVVLTTFLMPIVLLASWNDIARSVRSYVFFMLFLETGMLGAFVVAERLPVLPVLGADAGADVLHHRHLGRAAAHLRRGQVLPVHDVRLAADAGRDPGRLLPVLRADGRSSTSISSRRRAAPRRRCSTRTSPSPAKPSGGRRSTGCSRPSRWPSP